MKKFALLILTGALLLSGCQDLSEETDALITEKAEEIIAQFDEVNDAEISAEIAAKAASLLKIKKAPEIADDANFDVKMDILEESRGHFINHFVSSRLPGEVMNAIQSGETVLYLGSWDGEQWNENPACEFWRGDAQLVKFENDSLYLTMFSSVEDQWGVPFSFADCLSAGTYYLKTEYKEEVYKGYFELSLPTIVKDYLESIRKNLLENIEIDGKVFDFTSSVAVVESGEWAVVQQTTKDFYKHISTSVRRPSEKQFAGDMTEWSYTGVFYPGRKVKLGSFQLGKYAVTQELYEAVMGEPGSNQIKNAAAGEIQAYKPADNVSWTEAVTFCNKLSELMNLEPCYKIDGSKVDFDITKNGWRLPTEAEWEFSARGGNQNSVEWNYAFAGCDYNGIMTPQSKVTSSNNAPLINEYAWNVSNNKGITHQVGMKKPNSLGLYDMSGNIFEWCQDYYSSLADFYDAYYKTDADDPDAVVNPYGATDLTFQNLPCNLKSRVSRCGAWQWMKVSYQMPYLCNLMVTSRDFSGPDLKSSGKDSAMGFRLARTITE